MPTLGPITVSVDLGFGEIIGSAQTRIDDIAFLECDKEKKSMEDGV
jgi:hypothetical protein